MVDQNEYFYCYSSNLFKFLKMEKKTNYICSGLHERTFRRFWQFKRDEELVKALGEYTQRGNNMGVILR